MKKKHYLSRNEAELVAKEYNRDQLFLRLRSLALRLQDSNRCFTLSAEDLFYHTICSVDDIIEKTNDTEADEMLYCQDLWQELRCLFAEKIECDDADCRYAATLVVCATENILTIGNRARYSHQCNALIHSTKEADWDSRSRIEPMICDVLYEEEAFRSLQRWMCDYDRSENCLSDDITQRIEQLRKENPVQSIDDEDEIVTKLLPFFWNDRDEAESFLSRIHGQPDLATIEIIVELVKGRKMTICNKKQLWTILHDYNLYGSSTVNFSNLLAKRNK